MLEMLFKKLILLFTEINIPRSRNNGNDSDYIYMDTLNGDDVGKYLSIRKTCLIKSSKLIFPEILEKNQTKGNEVLT